MASFQEIVTQQLCKIVKSLASIDNTLKPAGTARGKKNGWTYLQVGKSWFFEREITYTGAALTIDLDFSDTIVADAIQLNKIEQIWNDSTAKDFSIRIYGNPQSDYYIDLDNQTGNTGTSRMIQLGIEFKYPVISRLRIFSGANTINKTDLIKVQVDEL